MNEHQFWEIIEQTKAESKGECEQHQKLLIAALQRLSLAEIVAFETIFYENFDRTYNWKIWAAVYVIRNGCGDDAFYYFREWLMAQSKDFYNKAINDPDSLAEFGRLEEPLECEGFSDVALDAYEELTGEELSMDGLMPEPANPYGEDWKDEDLPRLLPRLTALYNF